MNIASELHSDFCRIDNRIKACKALNEDTDYQLISMLNDQLCVTIVGRLEQNIKKIFSGYASRHSNRKLERSISRLCQQFQNPNPDKITELVKLFDSDFGNQLSVDWKDEASDGNKIKQMVSIRIKIAHQTTNNSSLTIAKIEAYFRAYKNVVTLLQQHFLPQ
ncbi:MAG: hypothetical protein JJ879_06055 [Sneathiella sp.]|nr:hypothetical protein [Sneathiella sp.]